MQRKFLTTQCAFIFCCLSAINFVNCHNLSDHMKFCDLKFLNEDRNKNEYLYKDGCKLFYSNEELTTVGGVNLAESLNNFKEIIKKAWNSKEKNFEETFLKGNIVDKANDGRICNGLVLLYIAWKEFNPYVNGPYAAAEEDYDFPGFEYKEFGEQKKYVQDAIQELEKKGYFSSKSVNKNLLTNDVAWYLSSSKWYGWYYIKATIFDDYFSNKLNNQTCNYLPILREDEFKLFPKLNTYYTYYKKGSKEHKIELEMEKIAKIKKFKIEKLDDEFSLPPKDWNPKEIETKQEKFPEPIMPLKEDNTVVTNSNAETEAATPEPESERELIMGTTKAEKTYKDDIEEIGSYKAIKDYQDEFDRWAYSFMSISTMLSRRMQKWEGRRAWLNQFKLNVGKKYGLNGLTLYVDEIDDKGLYTITIANKKSDEYCSLGDEFSRNEYVKSVTIGKGVKLFASDEHFKNIRLGEEKRIDFLTRHGPFWECKNLEEVTLPEDLNCIPEKAFSRTALKFIRIPKTVETIGRATFYNALKLEEVEFEAGAKLKEINAWAFRIDDEENEKLDFVGLKSISIPDSCTFIGEEAFYGQKKTNRVSFTFGLRKSSSLSI